MRFGFLQEIIDIIRLKSLNKYLFAKPLPFSGLYLSLKRKKENAFDHLISLGGNCEIAYRQYLYFSSEESSLFNWYASNGIIQIINALNNFNKIGLNGFSKPDGMSKCKNTSIWFHYKNNVVPLKGETQEQATLRELSQRISYLKEKFLKILKSNETKLYIYKVIKEDIDENINEKIKELYNCLINLGGNNFKLLIISEEKYKSYFKENEYFTLRTVKFFADNKDVTNKKYLNNGFRKIFDEFYYTKVPKKKKKEYKFNSNK